MKKTKTSSSSKAKSAAAVELPNISHPPLKEYDIQFSLINNNNNNNINDNKSSNKEEFRVVADSVYYSNYQLLFTVDQQQQQEVLVYKVNASSSTASSPSFELIHIVRQPPSKSLVSKPSSNNTINYMHVDKLKKWLFVNYRSSGLHVHDITVILNNNNINNNNTTTTTTTTSTTSLIASNILGTSNYYAIAIDELYKNQKIVTLNTQGLSVYEYHKPESATTSSTSTSSTTSAKIDYRTNRVQMTTKQRSVHMSLSHMSEQSLEFSYVKCVGDYIMIAQPRTSMSYTLVQLDATIKAFSHSGNNNNNNNSMLNIEDLTKSSSSETSGESSPSSQSSSPLPSQSSQSSQSSASVKTRRVKSSTTVQDTIIPNQWPMYGKLDNHFPKIVRLFGKAVLLRAGRNRLVTGELSGIVTTTNSQSYANNRDPITGSNYQYRASEYIFDQSLVDVALSGVWLTGVYASSSSSTHIILDAAQVVQPHHHGGDNNTESVATEQQEEQEVHHVKCQLPIVNALTGAADERLEIVAVGNGDFIVVVCGDLYYIEAKYE